MWRREFVILLAADSQEFACQLLDRAVVCDMDRCDFLADQSRNEFNHDGRFALVEVRDDLIAGFYRQADDMTVCTRCLLLRLGRLRHLGHFQCDRRALCRAEYGLDRLLIERDLAVFGVDRQIGIGLVSHILHEGHIERQLHIVRALAVCLADLQHDLRGLFLRRLLDDLIVMLAVYLDRSDHLLRTVRIGLFAYLDLRRCGGRCRTGSTGGNNVRFCFRIGRIVSGISRFAIRIPAGRVIIVHIEEYHVIPIF